jgi:hypothetical protein
MTSRQHEDEQRPLGRKRATQTGVLVGVRMQPDILHSVDSWRRMQDDLPSRPDAIRRLVELGLRRED